MWLMNSLVGLCDPGGMAGLVFQKNVSGEVRLPSEAIPMNRYRFAESRGSSARTKSSAESMHAGGKRCHYTVRMSRYAVGMSGGSGRVAKARFSRISRVATGRKAETNPDAALARGRFDTPRPPRRNCTGPLPEEEIMLRGLMMDVP